MRVILSEDAQKHYDRIPKTQKAKVKKRLISLVDNPYAGKKLGGELAGYRSLRVWPYRILYSINIKDKRVEVSAILHRQGAYN